MPQRWFIRNASTDRLTGRNPLLCGYQKSVGHVTEMTGHVPEFGGHAAETGGHDGPKYAIGRPSLPTARLPTYMTAKEIAPRPQHPEPPSPVLVAARTL